MDRPKLDQHRLERLVEAGRALVSRRELDDVLEYLLSVAREVTGAQYAAIGVLDARRGQLARFLTAGVDAATHRRIGDLPRGRGVLGVLIGDPRPLRLRDVSTHPASFGFPPEHPPMRTFLGVPILVRGQAFGNLYLTEKQGGEFDQADEDAVGVLADWAAIAIENARWAADERLRHSIEAAEQERRRWARELHDETLQGLGGLRVLLASGLRHGDDSALRGAVRDGLAQIGVEIVNLRTLITELRPAALDEIGLVPALETLAERVSAVEELAVETNFDLALEEPLRLPPDIENTVYRMVQEALTNAAKHAGASVLRVDMLARDGSLEVSVRDDGCGFDPDRVAGGFGLTGMRERVALVGGTLRIESAPQQGTRLTASIPVSRPSHRR